MTCTCVRGSEGFVYDPERDMWVHATCRQPTPAEATRKELEELL